MSRVETKAGRLPWLLSLAVLRGFRDPASKSEADHGRALLAPLSLLLLSSGSLYLVDVGSGAPRNLATGGWPPARVEGVFLTHFHSDHIDGLGELGLQR